jgi:probable F420-dependent oxidoreductase
MLVGVNLILNDKTLPMREVAPRVEERGLDALFIGEHTHTPVATVHPAYPGGLPEFYKRFLDPFVQLGVAAALTQRIRIGTGVVLVAERNPLELAKALASLDVVSGGRLEVGVGFGWNRLEMINNGVEPSCRREVFREKIDVIRRLWTEETIAADGTYVRFSESWSFPKPLQRPHPPILIGAAASAATFEDVVERGTGWYPLTDRGLPAQLAALAERAGGVLPPTTVVEMEGQSPGSAWYTEDRRARDSLHRRAQRHAENGVFRMSVGVPAEDVGALDRALDHLARISEVVS